MSANVMDGAEARRKLHFDTPPLWTGDRYPFEGEHSIWPSSRTTQSRTSSPRRRTFGPVAIPITGPSESEGDAGSSSQR